MKEPRLLSVRPEMGSARLDRVLAEVWPDFSRSRLQALIRDGHVTVDGIVERDPSARLRGSGAVRLTEPDPVPAAPEPEAIPLDIVYEDDELLVIDKPAGLVVHPGAGNERGTLVNALIAHCGATLSGIGGVSRPGIVHRLDKDTSGLLVVAKTDRAHRGLSEQFADHGRTGPLQRAYLAFVWGAPEPARGTVEGDIARSEKVREKMTVVAPGRGRRAVTHYAVEEMFAASPDVGPVATRVRCTLETGRTHQIRVHLAHIRHPLLGDDTYGAGFRTKEAVLPAEAAEVLRRLGRQALHATLLQFEHPGTGEALRFESELPPDLADLQAALRRMCGSAQIRERRGCK